MSEEIIKPKRMSAADIMKMAKSIKEKKESSNRKFVDATFVPEGTHVIRVLTDPVGELFRTVVTNGYFGRGIQTPSTIDNLPENIDFTEFEDLKEELNDYRHWKFGDKYNFLFYCHIIKTSAPNDTWKPGNTVVGIAKKKFETAFNDMIINLSEDSPEVLESMFNPSVPGVSLTVNVTMGMQGGVTITPGYKPADPVELNSDNYQPLSQAYIKDGFDKEKFDKLVKMMREFRDEVVAGRRQRGLPCWGDPEWESYSEDEPQETTGSDDSKEKAPEQVEGNEVPSAPTSRRNSRMDDITNAEE